MLAALLAQIDDHGDHMDGNGWGWGMAVFWLIVLALSVALVVFLIRHFSSDGRGRDGISSAQDILAERFARGEIDEDEYRKRRTALGS